MDQLDFGVSALLCTSLGPCPPEPAADVQLVTMRKSHASSSSTRSMRASTATCMNQNYAYAPLGQAFALEHVDKCLGVAAGLQRFGVASFSWTPDAYG
jgi:hypothetical protein